MATVIRVKRRKTDDPAEALLVISKAKNTVIQQNVRQKIKPLSETEKKIFRFATTVKSKSPMNEEVKEKVRIAILRQQKSQQLKERSRSVFSEKKPFMFLKNKLKGMTVHQQSPLAKSQLVYPPRKYSTQHRSSSPERAAHFTTNAAAAPNKLVKQSSAVGVQSHPLLKQSSKKQHFSRSDGQTRYSKPETAHRSGRRLNSEEKLTISLNSSSSEEEHVYDLYYCPKTADQWNVKDVLYVKPVKFKSVDSLSKLVATKSEKQEEKKVSKPSKHKYNKSVRAPDVDDDSFDEDERRFIFDEEEDFYDSDDYDVNGRDDDDSFGSFFGGGHSDYDGDAMFNDYDDNVANDLAAYEPSYDYNNDNYDDYGGNE